MEINICRSIEFISDSAQADDFTELKQMLAQKFLSTSHQSRSNRRRFERLYDPYPTGLIAEAEDLVVDGPYRMWGLGGS